MKISTGLVAVATVLSLAACKPADTTEAPAAEEAAAPAADTPEQVAARIKAELSPQDYALRLLKCDQAITTAKRAREGSFDPELTAKVNDAPKLDFFTLVREARELGADSTTINTHQHSGLPLPQRVEDTTPEYVAETRECLALVTAEAPTKGKKA